MRDEVHIGTDQLSHQLGKSLIAPLRSAVLDDDVRALDTAEVTQAEPESLKPGSKRRRGCKAQNPTPSSHELRSRNGILWYRGGGWPSFRLDIGCPDHLAPLLGIFGDELAELGGRV
jgi:hypothetical protein